MSDGITAAAGVAGAVSAASVLASTASAAGAPPQLEAMALTHALQIEQLLLIAYRQVVASPVIHPPVAGQLRTQLGQEITHVEILQQALASRGEIVPTPPNLEAAQDELSQHQVHWSLTDLRNQHDCLKLLVDVESLAENAYFQAVGEIQDPALLRTCAEIMACEAQHWTVLSGFLNHQNVKKAVPYPFVEGSP
ncbi:MAG TPA: ferritin-like domain-containing protein [Solirubrobacteraceae bacterium]|nr:ferritin-like domain-containing protein [Solirubrobacteraceae bacterium]